MVVTSFISRRISRLLLSSGIVRYAFKAHRAFGQYKTLPKQLAYRCKSASDNESKLRRPGGVADYARAMPEVQSLIALQHPETNAIGCTSVYYGRGKAASVRVSMRCSS
jgi:hypothetical protein